MDVALPDLKVINLNTNHLSGSIPSPLPPLMTHFWCTANQLTGAARPPVPLALQNDLLANPTYRGGSRLCPNKLEWDSVGDIFWNSATGRFPWFHDPAFAAEACSYAITPSAGAHGGISPATAQTVLPQAEPVFTATQLRQAT